MKNLISTILVAMMLSFVGTAVVMASEKEAPETSEKETMINEQTVKDAAVTQKAAEEVKEVAAEAKEDAKEVANKAKEEAAGVTAKAKEDAAEKKEQPGFEASFAAIGLLAVATIALKRRN